jgi:hypothetical protein
VYSLNPGLTEMLTKERLAELSRRGGHGQRARSGFRTLRSFRNAAGWALVEIGLRLAVPRRGTAPRRSVVRRRSAVRSHAAVPVAR